LGRELEALISRYSRTVKRLGLFRSPGFVFEQVFGSSQLRGRSGAMWDAAFSPDGTARGRDADSDGRYSEKEAIFKRVIEMRKVRFRARARGRGREAVHAHRGKTTLGAKHPSTLMSSFYLEVQDWHIETWALMKDCAQAQYQVTERQYTYSRLASSSTARCPRYPARKSGAGAYDLASALVKFLAPYLHRSATIFGTASSLSSFRSSEKRQSIVCTMLRGL